MSDSSPRAGGGLLSPKSQDDTRDELPCPDRGLAGFELKFDGGGRFEDLKSHGFRDIQLDRVAGMIGVADREILA